MNNRGASGAADQQPDPQGLWAGDLREFAAGFGRLMTGRTLAMGLQFIALTLLARRLGPADFGLIQFVASIFVYVAFLGDLGLSVVGARDLGRTARDDTRISELIGSRALLTCLTAAAVVTCVLLAPISPRERTVILIFTAGFAASAVNVRWLLQARERFALLAGVEVVASVAHLCAVLILVQGRGDVDGAAAALAVYPLILGILSVIVSRPGRRAFPRLTRAGIMRIRTSVRLGLAIIATAIYFSADTVLLGVFRTDVEVGFYSAAYKVVLAGLMIPVMANTVALPMVARIRNEGPEALTNLLENMTRALLLVALPLTVGTALTAPVIVGALFGEAYLRAAAPLALLMVTLTTVSANVPFAATMLAEHRDRTYLRITLTGVVVNVSANLVAVPLFGMIGAATVTILTELTVTGLILHATRPVSWQIVRSAVGSVAIPTAVMAVVVWPLRDMMAAIPIGIAAFVMVGLATGRLRPVGLNGRHRSSVSKARE